MDQWPDSSLYHRFRSAVEILARGKGDYGHRAYAAALQIIVLTPSDFPSEDLLQHYMAITALTKRAASRYENALYFSGLGGMSPKDRDRFTTAILSLYEAAAAARGANRASRP